MPAKTYTLVFPDGTSLGGFVWSVMGWYTRSFPESGIRSERFNRLCYTKAAIEEHGLVLVEGDAPTPSRLVEMSLAYEHAADAIKRSCDRAPLLVDFPDFEEWHDLSSLDGDLIDITDEVAYLESRRLLERHPNNPNWISICDEGEPLPAAGPIALERKG